MKKSPRLKSLLLALSFVAPAFLASTAKADIVVDGGFENPVISGPSATAFQDFTTGQSIGTDPGTWTVIGDNDVILVRSDYPESPLTFNAHGGNNVLDLTGIGNSGSGNGIMETLATTLGTTYTVSFFVGRADDSGVSGNYNGAATINLSIGGGPALGYTNSNVTTNGVNYENFTVNFTATGSSTTITFTNGTSLPTAFAGLDDVSVEATVIPTVPTPEPGTFGMAGLGLLVSTGAWLRRRKHAGV